MSGNEVFMKWFLIVLLFALSGCATADFVKKEYHPKRGGQVKYSFSGDRKAAEKMQSHCGGQYRIISESKGSENNGFVAIPNAYSTVVQPRSKKYTYLDFECI
jgi:hypothetical protein